MDGAWGWRMSRKRSILSKSYAEFSSGEKGYYWLIVALSVLIGLLAGSFIICATAHAAPADPHIPNPQTGYCPGGGAGSMVIAGYCDGVPYPDGSFWHYVQYGYPLIGKPEGLLGVPMQCVVNSGGPIPAPAPKGGCGGAVK